VIALYIVLAAVALFAAVILIRAARFAPKKQISEMNDEEMLELFRTDEAYANDDPEELLALQHILRKNTTETNQVNA
jgi:hypothetical protein